MGFYNPRISRMLTEDPIRSGINWYLYANANPILYIDPWGLDAYYFYAPDFKNEAEDDIKLLMEYYGLTRDQVHLIEVNSKDDMTNGWNNMGYVLDANGNRMKDKDGNYLTVSIDAAVINSHGSQQSVTMGSKGNWIYFQEADIAALESRKVGALILMGCNNGHLDYVGNNIASYFAQKVYGAPVLAGDGSTSAGIKSFLGIAGERKYSSGETASWRKLREDANPGSKRKNQGWVVYQVDSTGKLNTYASGIRGWGWNNDWGGMSIREMLDHLSFWQ